MKKRFVACTTRCRQLPEVRRNRRPKENRDTSESYENFTSRHWDRIVYRDFLLPVYRECFPILEEAGKIVGVHYDGRIASCKDLVAQAPIDVIESFTTPPEGTCRLPRRARQGRASGSGATSTCPTTRSRRRTAAESPRCRSGGAAGGRELAFEVSEHLPQN